MTVQSQIRRVRNVFRKALAGLPPGGERVWPGLRNDLFVAHESIYRFFSQHAAKREVLDAGCGTGYGSALLVDGGASRVLGIDISAAAIRYAQRQYREPRLDFRVADCEELVLDRKFDLIVSSNVLEHLRDPLNFLDAARLGLREEGIAIVVVPPITDEQHLIENQKNSHHLSNLTVGGWADLCESAGFSAELFRHSHDSWRALDFSSHEPSVFTADDFWFLATEFESFSNEHTLSAVFVLTPER